MKVPWWLHRILIVVFSGVGFFGGAYMGLKAASTLSRMGGMDLPEALAAASVPAGAIIGVFIPVHLFRRWIHAKCPVDGDRMIFERIRSYDDGHGRTGKLVSRYQCPTCGLTK